MKIRPALAAIAWAMGFARAEIPPPPDDLSKAYDTALAELRTGQDRQGIAERLNPVVDGWPASHCAQVARPFLEDLMASAKNPPGKPDDPPEQRLAEARVPFHLLRYAENWEEPLKAFVAKVPEDPVAQLVAADRAVISRLIPRLADRSPARCDNSPSRDGMAPQPRVCDLALALIEVQGMVRFHHDTIQGTYLHQLPDAEREKVVERVVAWWGDVKDQPVAAGVRAQLSHGTSYPEAVWMAKTLARIADQPDDRAFGRHVLLEMVKQNPRGHVGAHAAEALVELGDLSAVVIFYAEWKSWLGRPGLIHDSHIAFFLCRHGGRREWELLHDISLAEVREGKGPGAGAVWACAVNRGVAGTNPYAIPILGLALDQTEQSGSRSVETGTQSFSYADTACELFQKQVERDFGYRRSGTAAERRAAIQKAQAWWAAEGRDKYSFDFIEAKMVPMDAGPLPTER